MRDGFDLAVLFFLLLLKELLTLPDILLNGYLSFKLSTRSGGFCGALWCSPMPLLLFLLACECCSCFLWCEVCVCGWVWVSAPPQSKHMTSQLKSKSKKWKAKEGVTPATTSCSNPKAAHTHMHRMKQMQAKTSQCITGSLHPMQSFGFFALQKSDLGRVTCCTSWNQSFIQGWQW